MKHNATPAASTAIRTNHGKARWATEVTGAPLGGVEGIGKKDVTHGSAAKLADSSAPPQASS